jgi:hypothetical protein
VTSRCLVLVRAGDNSVHESWLTPSAQKCFDLAVSYYGGTPGRFADRADHYSARTGPKLPRVADWLDDNWEWVSGFDFVAIPDDDLSASAGVWSTVFDVMDRHRLDLAQPSFGRDSNWCHPITAERPGSSFRVTNFIENGLAVFSARALEWCAPTLRLGSSGVGSDYAWAAIVRANGGRVGIVDEVHVEHVRAHHGAGATTHQSADSLASVLTHPEMYDELLLMATFGIANPYDPFVEEAVCVDGSNRVDGSDGVDGSERRRRDDAAPTTQGTDPGPLGSPLSFVVVGSGTVAGVRATVDSLSRRAVADDEIIVVDATFDSHLSGCLGADGGSVRLVSAPDRGLAECYDLAIAAAAHPTAVVVASGWTLGPAFRPSLAAATSRGPNDLVIDGFAPVAAIGRELVAALGGMGALSRAVTTGFGKVGTREMLETAERLAGAAGKRVVVGSLDASVVTTAEEPAIPAPPFSAGVGGQPPTRRLHGALLRAVHPTAVDAVLAVGRLVSDDQAMQYARLVATKWPQWSGTSPLDPATWSAEQAVGVSVGPYRVSALVHALVRRGTVGQAASLLATYGLPAGTPAAEVEEAVAVMTAAGRDGAELVSASAPGPAAEAATMVMGLLARTAADGARPISERAEATVRHVRLGKVAALRETALR